MLYIIIKLALGICSWTGFFGLLDIIFLISDHDGTCKQVQHMTLSFERACVRKSVPFDTDIASCFMFLKVSATIHLKESQRWSLSKLAFVILNIKPT